MHYMLRILYCWLGVLPLASSNWLQVVASIYSWTIYIFLVSLVNYFEVLFDKLWIGTGQNIVTGCLGTVVDFLVYSSLFYYNLKFSLQRSICKRMVDAIRSTDLTIVTLTVLVGFILGASLYQYSILLLHMPNFFKPQLYKAWVYTFLSYQCFLIVLQFCAVIDSMTARITNLKSKLKVRTATPALLYFLDTEKDKSAKFMTAAMQLFSKFILCTSMDVFCRSVHYLYIVLWGVLQAKHNASFIFFMPFAVVSGVRILMLLHLTTTCSKAKKSVADFNRQLFKVVLESKYLQENETLQIIITRRNSVKFTPGGFYELGKRFMVSRINAIAIYLTVLVQVSNLKSS